MSTRGRRATLAFLLALVAAVGMGLVATGVTRVGDSLPTRLLLVVVGLGFVLSAFRWLRAINARNARLLDDD